MVVVLLLILIAVALGIVGWVVKGLIYLFVIGIIVFVLALLWSGFRAGRWRR